VLGVYVLTPGEISLDPVRMGDPKLLVLGIGTTLGIVAQALILIPALHRVGVRWRPRWGWDRRLAEAGVLASWVIGYVLIGQAGYIVTTRVAASADAGAVSTYATAWLLLQVPYGVVGVSLLTALMPTLSRSAAEGRTDRVVADLSRGSRLSTVALLPISVLLTLFGGALGIALFAHGANTLEAATRLGLTVAVSAFSLLPFAIVMLQLRVFYAMKDSRTPTVIQLIVVAVKVPLLLCCPLVLPPSQVVLGLAAVNGLSFVVGAVVGHVWLRRRLGALDTVRVLVTFGKTTLAAVVAGLAAIGVTALLDLGGLARIPVVPHAWVVLAIGGLIGGAGCIVLMRILRMEELTAAQRVLGRRGDDADADPATKSPHDDPP
jgi:putative peptidoglycan lipid II flippase